MSHFSFLNQVRETCHRMQLFPSGSGVLVAVSGGPDSVALLLVLNRLAPEWDLSLTAAHLNHQTRGPESDADAAFVAALADRLRLPCVVASQAVPRESGEDAGSFQNAARKMRRAFLEAAARDRGADFIATGHTADDQAETVLMNLFRGSGLRGLAGMPPRHGQFVRPLLDCTRRQVLDFLGEENAEYRTDSSNQNPAYLRNRIRLDLIPDLENRYAPHLRERLAQMARLLQQDEACLTEQAESVLNRADASETPGHRLLLSEVSGQAPAVQGRVIREIIRRLKGDLKRVESRHIQQVLRMIPEKSPPTVILPGNIQVSRTPETLQFEQIRRPVAGILRNEAPPDPVRLDIPGDTLIEPGGITFHAEVKAPKECDPRTARINQAFVDYDLVQEGVWARFFREGDRFSPLGTQGSKKLKAFFIDEKVPREDRRRIPLLTDASGDIIWVYGRRISHRFRVTPNTRNVLFLEGLA